MITVMLKIKDMGFKPVELELRKGKYTNGHLAIRLIETKSKEPWCDLTVCLVDAELDDGEFFVKTWSENADTTTALIEQTDLFVNTGRIVPTGFVNANVWKFKDPTTLDKMRGL